jgi:hypothetical protein
LDQTSRDATCWGTRRGHDQPKAAKVAGHDSIDLVS